MIVLVVAGCQTASYYGQAIRGEYQILRHERPIAKVLADPAVKPSLKARLRLILKLRAFAARHLDLPVDRHYLRYADLGRPYVVWDVYATPEFSLKPVSWWYPIVGRLTYRGYFSERAARRYAARLRLKGYDVDVEGVEAYSTLGWFRDPVLNTFVHDPDAELAETLFHELTHQRLFIGGDTDFDEAFATAVGEEGVRRWFKANGNRRALAAYGTELKRHTQVIGLILQTRRRLEALYASARPNRACTGCPSPAKQTDAAGRERERKAAILDAARREYARLKARWNGYSGFDRSFGKSLNNAQLNAAATYYRLVPAFDYLLREDHGSLERLFRAVAALGRMPKAERHLRLAELSGLSRAAAPHCRGASAKPRRPAALIRSPGHTPQAPAPR